MEHSKNYSKWKNILDSSELERMKKRNTEIKSFFSVLKNDSN